MSTHEAGKSGTTDLRYPIGHFACPDPNSVDEREEAIAVIAELPERLRNAVSGLNELALRTPYRPGGWTVRQVVHHLADSHMNAFVRIRLALTEDAPTICAYDESAWAALHDSHDAPLEWSLQLLEGLHARWIMLLQSLKPEQWKRTYVHPQSGSTSVHMATLLYAWHSRHHTAHITHLRAQQGW